MSEIFTEPVQFPEQKHEAENSRPTLTDLAEFDEALQHRIELIQCGYSPNGHSPNGMLSAVLNENHDTDAEIAFIEEYRWALALSIYGHKESEDPRSLMLAAEDSLFEAAASYDTQEEPNFLTHLSRVISKNLLELYGPSDGSKIPPVNEFEGFVRGETQQALPPLPLQRQASDFIEGQQVLYVLDDKIVTAKVEAVKPYKNLWKPDPNATTEISQEELQAKKQHIEDCVKWLPFTNGYPGWPISSETVGTLVSMVPEWQVLVPDKRPGFVTLGINTEDTYSPNKIIIDMDRSEIIPQSSWERIKQSPVYRSAYLSTAPAESQRHNEAIEAAFDKRIAQEKHMSRHALAAMLD